MNKAVKLTMIAVGIVATLVLAAVIIFAATFDINDYKGRISQAVTDETGRSIKFADDLGLTIFPSLGVKLGGVSLSNAPGFGQKPMVQVVSAHVSVRLFPLLQGQIKFGHLKLDGLTLNLSRNKHGVSNWDDLVGRAEKEDANPDAASDGSFSLEVDGVVVKNANLIWDDRKTDFRFAVSEMSLNTGAILEGETFPMDAALLFECSRPDIRGKLVMSGSSSLNFSKRQYSHTNVKLSVKAEGEGLPGGAIDGKAALESAVMDFNTEHGQFKGLTATAYDVTVHLDTSLEGITTGIKKLAGTIAVDPFDARKAMADLGLEPLNAADTKALTKVSGSGEFFYAPRHVEIKSLTADMDGCPIKGRARATRSEEGASYFARLDVGKLDLDRYLPPKGKNDASKAASSSTDDRILNADILRRLALDIEAKVAELRIKGVRLENVKAEAKARHGLVRLSPVSADLYKGRLSMGATINALGKYPKTDIIAGLDKVDLGGLSRDALGDESYDGTMDFKATLTCDGDRISSMLRTMNGKVSFNLRDGIFPGVDLIRMAKTTREAKEKGGKTVEAAKTDSTQFGAISGTGIITGGVLKNRDLEVKAPGLRAHGEGVVSLASRAIDYLLKVKLVASSRGQGGKSTDDSIGVMVPIRVSGTLDDPRYWVSISEYVKALGGAAIGLAGSVLGGVTNVIKGVGGMVIPGESKPETDKKEEPEKKNGIMNLFGLF